MGTSFTPAALDAGLSRLVKAGTINAAQALAVRGEIGIGAPQRVAGAAHAEEGTAGAAPADRSWTAILAEVGGYIGAAFVGGAILTAAVTAWDELTWPQHFSLLAVPALLLLVAAGLVAASVPGRWSPSRAPAGSGPRRRLVGTLVVLAAALAAGAAAVVVGQDGSAVPPALVGLLVVAGGYAACRTTVLHLASAAAALVTVYVVGDEAGAPWAVVGGCVVALGVAWAGLALAGVLAERATGLVTAAAVAFVGGQNLVLDSSGAPAAGYVVLALVALAALGGYVVLRHVALLAAGTAALAVVVPQVVLDYSDGALGAAGALLVVGLSIVAASVVGLRLRGAALPEVPSTV